MCQPAIAAIVPAAGEARRFGSRKLLADLAGVPLIERTIASLLEGGVGRVVVVIRRGDTFHAVPSLADSRVRTVLNPDPARGMFSSIQAGLAVAGGDVVLVLPADMPFVSAATVAAVAARAAASSSVVVPVHEGRRGHPVAIPHHLCDRLLKVPATMTLKEAIAGLPEPSVHLDVADRGILRDVDVPADLAIGEENGGRSAQAHE